MAEKTPGREIPSFVPPLLLAGACALVFANSLGNGFHLDDHYRVLDNPEVRRVQPIGRHFLDPSTISGTRGVSESRLHQLAQYRPLLPLTLSLNYAVGAYDVTGYHVANVLLHAVAAILAYLLLLEALGVRPTLVPIRGALEEGLRAAVEARSLPRLEAALDDLETGTALYRARPEFDPSDGPSLAAFELFVQQARAIRDGQVDWVPAPILRRDEG